MIVTAWILFVMSGFVSSLFWLLFIFALFTPTAKMTVSKGGVILWIATSIMVAICSGIIWGGLFQ